MVPVVSDVSLWVPLGTAVVAAAAALAGSALGPMVGARRAHKQWLRDKRAELLEDFHAALVEADEDVSTRSMAFFWRGDNDPVDERELRGMDATSSQILDRLRDASARATLYTSLDLSNNMETVVADYHVVYASQESYEREKWEKDATEWRQLVDKTTMQIRRELGVDG